MSKFTVVTDNIQCTKMVVDNKGQLNMVRSKLKAMGLPEIQGKACSTEWSSNPFVIVHTGAYELSNHLVYLNETYHNYRKVNPEDFLKNESYQFIFKFKPLDPIVFCPKFQEAVGQGHPQYGWRIGLFGRETLGSILLANDGGAIEKCRHYIMPYFGEKFDEYLGKFHKFTSEDIVNFIESAQG